MVRVGEGLEVEEGLVTGLVMIGWEGLAVGLGLEVVETGFFVFIRIIIENVILPNKHPSEQIAEITNTPD